MTDWFRQEAARSGRSQVAGEGFHRCQQTTGAVIVRLLVQVADKAFEPATLGVVPDMLVPAVHRHG